MTKFGTSYFFVLFAIPGSTWVTSCSVIKNYFWQLGGPYGIEPGSITCPITVLMFQLLFDKILFRKAHVLKIVLTPPAKKEISLKIIWRINGGFLTVHSLKTSSSLPTEGGLLCISVSFDLICAFLILCSFFIPTVSFSIPTIWQETWLWRTWSRASSW